MPVPMVCKGYVGPPTSYPHCSRGAVGRVACCAAFVWKAEPDPRQSGSWWDAGAASDVAGVWTFPACWLQCRRNSILLNRFNPFPEEVLRVCACFLDWRRHNGLA